MKPSTGNPEIDKLHAAALVVMKTIDAQSGMKVMNDGPTRKLHLEEAYRKITQDGSELDLTDTDVYAKPTVGLPPDDDSIIDLTRSGDESSKASESAEVVVKQEAAEDIIPTRGKKNKGKGVVRPAKGGLSGGNVDAKTYRHGDGKVTGKAAVTETVLGAVANHLSPEAQEKRDLSRMNLFRESRYQDRQDQVLEEREREMNKLVEDLKHKNNTLRERAASAETRLSIAYSYGFSPVSVPLVYPSVPTPPAYPPSTHIPAVPPFATDPSQYMVFPTIHDYSESEGTAGPGPRTMDHHQGFARVDVDDLGDWEEE